MGEFRECTTSSERRLATKVLLGTPRGTRVRNAAPERVYIPSPERNGQNAQSTYLP